MASWTVITSVLKSSQVVFSFFKYSMSLCLIVSCFVVAVTEGPVFAAGAEPRALLWRFSAKRQPAW